MLARDKISFSFYRGDPIAEKQVGEQVTIKTL